MNVLVYGKLYSSDSDKYLQESVIWIVPESEEKLSNKFYTEDKKTRALG